MKLIVGLGNPGREYESTRHNVGFMTVDRLSEKLEIPAIKAKHRALLGDKTIGGQKVMLVKPMTYMNLSGESVGEIVRFYKIAPEDVIVVYDDTSLPTGTLRVREGGSDGGHNGMKSLIQHLGTQQFPRIRIGIGEKPAGWDLADYVTSKFSEEEQPLIAQAVRSAADCAKMLLTKPIQETMNRYNKRPKKVKAKEEAIEEEKKEEPTGDQA